MMSATGSASAGACYLQLASALSVSALTDTGKASGTQSHNFSLERLVEFKHPTD
jgi:hypothetical protein